MFNLFSQIFLVFLCAGYLFLNIPLLLCFLELAHCE